MATTSPQRHRHSSGAASPRVLSPRAVLSPAAVSGDPRKDARLARLVQVREQAKQFAQRMRQQRVASLDAAVVRRVDALENKWEQERAAQLLELEARAQVLNSKFGEAHRAAVALLAAEQEQARQAQTAWKAVAEKTVARHDAARAVVERSRKPDEAALYRERIRALQAQEREAARAYGEEAALQPAPVPVPEPPPRIATSILPAHMSVRVERNMAADTPTAFDAAAVELQKQEQMKQEAAAKAAAVAARAAERASFAARQAAQAQQVSQIEASLARLLALDQARKRYGDTDSVHSTLWSNEQEAHQQVLQAAFEAAFMQPSPIMQYTGTQLVPETDENTLTRASVASASTWASSLEQYSLSSTASSVDSLSMCEMPLPSEDSDHHSERLLRALPIRH